MPNTPTWYQRLGAALVFGAVKSVCATLRFSYIDRGGYYEQASGAPVIFCVWHNRLAVCLSAYFAYALRRNPTMGMAAMVSASRDGAFLTAILESFGVQPVRGSSSRRGPQALLELTGWAERGYDLAITPDGPRGPRYVVQEGVMALAQVTGLPIIPVSYNLGRKLQLKSWDRFQIPCPLARCEVILARPIRVPRDIPEDERERLRLEVQASLVEITRD